MEAGLFKSGWYGGRTGELPIVVCLSFCVWDIADGFETPGVGEPGHPFEDGRFDGFPGFQRDSPVDQFDLVGRSTAGETPKERP